MDRMQASKSAEALQARGFAVAPPPHVASLCVPHWCAVHALTAWAPPGTLPQGAAVRDAAAALHRVLALHDVYFTRPGSGSDDVYDAPATPEAGSEEAESAPVEEAPEATHGDDGDVPAAARSSISDVFKSVSAALPAPPLPPDFNGAEQEASIETFGLEAAPLLPTADGDVDALAAVCDPPPAEGGRVYAALSTTAPIAAALCHFQRLRLPPPPSESSTSGSEDLDSPPPPSPLADITEGAPLDGGEPSPPRPASPMPDAAPRPPSPPLDALELCGGTDESLPGLGQLLGREPDSDDDESDGRDEAAAEPPPPGYPDGSEDALRERLLQPQELRWPRSGEGCMSREPPADMLAEPLVKMGGGEPDLSALDGMQCPRHASEGVAWGSGGRADKGGASGVPPTSAFGGGGGAFGAASPDGAEPLHVASEKLSSWGSNCRVASDAESTGSGRRFGRALSSRDDGGALAPPPALPPLEEAAAGDDDGVPLTFSSGGGPRRGSPPRPKRAQGKGGSGLERPRHRRGNSMCEKASDDGGSGADLAKAMRGRSVCLDFL